MSLLQLVSDYVAYNAWANKKITTWLRNQDADILYAPCPSSYPTLDATLQHQLRAQKFWIAFITKQDFSNFSWAVREHIVEQILDELDEICDQMNTHFVLFDEVALAEMLELNMPWLKTKQTRFNCIQHIINHTSYHRGQLITMARTLGLSEGVPNTDYMFFLSEK